MLLLEKRTYGAPFDFCQVQEFMNKLVSVRIMNRRADTPVPGLNFNVSLYNICHLASDS